MRYRIMCREVGGEVFEGFTWTRTPQAGVQRAFAEAVRFDRPIEAAWAEPIPEPEES